MDIIDYKGNKIISSSREYECVVVFGDVHAAIPFAPFKVKNERAAKIAISKLITIRSAIETCIGTPYNSGHSVL